MGGVVYEEKDTGSWQRVHRGQARPLGEDIMSAGGLNRLAIHFGRGLSSAQVVERDHVTDVANRRVQPEDMKDVAVFPMV